MGVVVHPSGEGRGFVVEENTPVVYFRFSFSVAPILYIYVRMLFCRNVGPPVPWRYSHGRRQGIDSVSCTPFVASCYYHRIAVRFEDIFLSCSFEGVQLVFTKQFVYESSDTYRADGY